jgi:hypothetical protein
MHDLAWPCRSVCGSSALLDVDWILTTIFVVVEAPVAKLRGAALALGEVAD